MKRFLPKLTALLLGIFILGSGCAEPSTVAGPESGAIALSKGGAPELPAAAQELFQVKAVKRNQPLASNVSVTVVVDPRRETRAELPGIATVTFPAGTFAETRVITITAPRGAAVALDFTHVPADQFRKSVRIEVNLKGTEAEGNGALLNAITAGHFNSLKDVGLNSAAVDRTVPVTVLGGAAVFEVKGFSGWLCASGRCDEVC